MSQFAREDSQAAIDLISDGDVVLESDRNQDGVGDLVFRTAGVERARIKHDGTGTGWSNVLGGSMTYLARASGDTTGATDLAAILAKIGSTPGDYVFHPGDTYYVNGEITYYSGQRFWMYGATIIGTADFSTFANADDTVNDCGWFGGTLDTLFTYGGSYGTSYPSPTGIDVRPTSAATEKELNSFRIRDVTFKNLRIGIRLRNIDVDDVKRVGDVWINNIRGYHLYAALAQLDGKDVFLDGFYLDTGAFDCFDVHQGENVHISNGSCINNSQYGLLIRTLTKGNTKSVHVSNFTDGSTLGILITTDPASTLSQSVTDTSFSNVTVNGGGGFWANPDPSGAGIVGPPRGEVRVESSTRSSRSVYFRKVAGPGEMRLKVKAAASTLGTFTVTVASPAVFTLTNHGLAIGDAVYFTTTGALPTGLNPGQMYYVVSVADASTFEVSASYGGTAVNTSGTQSGTHTAVKANHGIECDACTDFQLDAEVNITSGTGQSCVLIDNTSGSTSDVRVRGNMKGGKYGVQCSGGARQRIDVTSVGQATDGILLASVTDSVVTGSIVTTAGAYGVRETGTSDRNVIVGCNLHGNTAGATSTVGASTVAANNAT